MAPNPQRNNKFPVSIQNYCPTDFQDCCDLFLSNTPNFFDVSELAGFQKYLRELSPDTYWIVRSHDGAPLACGGIYLKTPQEGRLCFGMVRKDMHKKKLGSLLLVYRLLKLMETPGLTHISLETMQDNPGFFSKYGFETTQTIENYYMPGLHRIDMLLTIDARKRDLIKQTYATLSKDLIL